MRPYILAETNWKALKNANFDLAVLPWGATEAHNYHLPYATDVYESDALAAESARIAWKKGAKVIVLPTIPFGVNTGQSDIYLDINLNPSTQLSILNDIITVLDRQGIKKLIIFNSHGGNNFKPLVRELGLRFPEMFLCFSNWFQSMDKTEYFDNEGDHWAERKWSQISEDTGVGDPAQATDKKGERYFTDVTQKIGNFFFELCNADLNDLYE